MPKSFVLIDLEHFGKNLIPVEWIESKIGEAPFLCYLLSKDSANHQEQIEALPQSWSYRLISPEMLPSADEFSSVVMKCEVGVVGGTKEFCGDYSKTLSSSGMKIFGTSLDSLNDLFFIYDYQTVANFKAYSYEGFSRGTLSLEGKPTDNVISSCFLTEVDENGNPVKETQIYFSNITVPKIESRMEKLKILEPAISKSTLIAFKIMGPEVVIIPEDDPETYPPGR
jgi:hypothetical protein